MWRVQVKADVWLEMNLEQRDRCHGRERGVLVEGLTRQNPNSSARGWEGFGNLVWIGVNRFGFDQAVVSRVIDPELESVRVFVGTFGILFVLHTASRLSLVQSSGRDAAVIAQAVAVDDRARGIFKQVRQHRKPGVRMRREGWTIHVKFVEVNEWIERFAHALRRAVHAKVLVHDVEAHDDV